MAYIHVPTLRYPLKERHVRQENPNTSFPSVFSPPPDYEAVQPSDLPEYDARTHRAEEVSPVLVDGVWTQQWSIVAKTPDEMQAEYDAKAAEVRSERDRLLSETDWIVIKSYERNENIPSEWEVYRQALRDITAQEGFPYNVTWPEKP